MARQYRVKEPFGTAACSFEQGDEVNADDLTQAVEESPDPVALNIDALVFAGYLEEKTASVACPACSEDKSIKKADVPSFQKQETLSEHYDKEHPALAPPDFEEVV